MVAVVKSLPRVDPLTFSTKVPAVATLKNADAVEILVWLAEKKKSKSWYAAPVKALDNVAVPDSCSTTKRQSPAVTPFAPVIYT